MDLWVIMVFLMVGFAIGFFNLLANRFLKLTEYLTTGGLIVLLLSMGAKIGANDQILSQLGEIGFRALFLALGSILGSLILLIMVSKRFLHTFESAQLDDPKLGEKQNGNMMSMIIFFSVIGGVLIGLFILPDTYFSYLEPITNYALGILLFGIGIDIGRNRQILIRVVDFGWKIVLIPILVGAGSIIGAFLMGSFLGMGGKEAAAIGAGFGWYSLSGIILSKIHSVEIGSLAFLTNIMRELITFLILPFVAKYLGKLACIAPGGATTMDVTLPIIKEVAGEEIVIPAFISGFVLSTLVPILVPLIINWG